jgi:hypothetical protein
MLNFHFPDIDNNEINGFFKRIKKYLKGETISFSSFSISTSVNLIISLGLTDFNHFIQLNYPEPTNTSEAISFLKNGFLSFLTTQYQEAIKVVSSNFDQFSEKDLIQLSIKTLDSILSCSKFQTKNETTLLSKIKKLIENNKQYLTLLKHIRFCFVDFEVMSIFLSNLDIIDIDYELFDLIIQNIKQPKETLYSSTRWTDNIKFISNQILNKFLKYLKHFSTLLNIFQTNSEVLFINMNIMKNAFLA